MRGEDNFFLRSSSLNDICLYLNVKKMFGFTTGRRSLSCIVPFRIRQGLYYTNISVAWIYSPLIYFWRVILVGLTTNHKRLVIEKASYRTSIAESKHVGLKQTWNCLKWTNSVKSGLAFYSEFSATFFDFFSDWGTKQIQNDWLKRLKEKGKLNKATL